MIYRGTIVGLFQEKGGGSGLALLGVEDDARGQMLIPCDGNPTCRMLNVVFPGALRDGKFHNDAIVGERIYFTLDDVGVLKAFAPEDRAPEEIIAQYERQSAPSPKGPGGGPGTHTRGGFLPPDHPLFGTGPIVSGRPILPPPKARYGGPGTFTYLGLLPPEDPVYSRGPIVAGREILKPPKKKPTDN